MAKIAFDIKCLVCKEAFKVMDGSDDIDFLCHQGLWIKSHHKCEKLERDIISVLKEPQDANKPAQS